MEEQEAPQGVAEADEQNLDTNENAARIAEEAENSPVLATSDGTDESVLIAEAVSQPAPEVDSAAALKAVIEAAIYITDQPLTAEQIATATEQPLEQVKEILDRLVTEYAAPDRGLSVREVAGGYKL